MNEINPVEKISQEFFQDRVTEVAEKLVGELLVNTENGAAGIIVETEAYLGVKDPASHLVKAGEKRQKTFDKGAGTVYVFKIYQHNNLNFLTEHENITEGVLIRAVEPVKDIEGMKKRRGVEEIEELCSGPGKLCEAFNISKEKHNGKNLSGSPLEIYTTEKNFKVKESPRIGISEAKKWPLRFTAEDSRFISQKVDRDKISLDLHDLYRD